MTDHNYYYTDNFYHCRNAYMSLRLRDICIPVKQFVYKTTPQYIKATPIYLTAKMLFPKLGWPLKEEFLK